MTLTAIIGGTGLTRMTALEIERRERVSTPYGTPSSDLVYGQLAHQPVVFLARHGDPHVLPPHKVNYRANLWALKQAGVSRIAAVAAVGGITPEMMPGKIAIADQLIDYTYGRTHTFFEEGLETVTHIDFSQPYTPALRESLLMAAESTGLTVVKHGVYGCTQGPRLETAAEITRMERDGCHLVGMTGMPEAALARELAIDYACIAVVANWAAGKQEGEITLEQIESNLHVGMTDLARLLESWLRASLQT